MYDAGVPWLPPSSLEGGTSQKLDSRLKELLAEPMPPEKIPVIVQTTDGLQDTDRQLIASLKGTIVADLWLIKGYSAELSTKAIQSLSLSDRVIAITYNTELFR